MVIVVEDGGVHMQDPSDFKAFKVVVKEGEDPEAIAVVGRLEGADTAWIQIEAVRRLAGNAVDQAWEDGYDAMLAYARTKGWLHDARREIQAHVERA
ncbi:MAG: hypothetical protein QOE35_2930 [Actinomycetota bacterium]|jgi:hypothetical protein